MKILQLFKSEENILKGGLLLFFAMTLASFGNYLFNMIMGRMLGPVDYGGLVSLMAFLAIIGVPAATIQTSAMKFSSTFQAHKKYGKTRFLISYATKKTLLVSLTIFLVIALASNYIARFLNLNSSLPLVFLGAACIFLFLLPLNRGVIQGVQDFRALSLNIGLEPIAKIILGTLLVYFGFKLNGAALTIFLSTAIIYCLSFYALNNILNSPPDSFPTKRFWQYSAPVLLALFLLNFLTYIDVVMIKHYFDPQEAGLYSAISTIAKIVLYFSLPFIAAMFPKISSLYAKRERHFPVLAQTFIVVSALSVAVMTFFMIFPEFSIQILFGQQYLAFSSLLGPLSLAMLLLALINVFTNYFLAIGRLTFIIPLAGFTLLEIILFFLFHQSLKQIINILILNFGGLFLSLSALYIFHKKERLINAISNYSRV